MLLEVPILIGNTLTFGEQSLVVEQGSHVRLERRSFRPDVRFFFTFLGATMLGIGLASLIVGLVLTWKIAGLLFAFCVVSQMLFAAWNGLPYDLVINTSPTDSRVIGPMPRMHAKYLAHRLAPFRNY